MSSDSTRVTITERFLAGFTPRHPTVPVKMENLPFKQPVNLPWVDFKIIDGDTTRANIGSARQFKTCGIVVIQVMVPMDSGSKLIHSIRDTLIEVLADRQFPTTDGSVTLYGFVSRQPRDVAGWHSVSHQCEWRNWHTRVSS